jgi:FkbM family methyltransferase
MIPKKLKSLAKECLTTLLKPQGYQLQKISHSNHWAERLALHKSLGFYPKTILDGGAHTGTWSKKAAKLFPNSTFLLVEPNPENLTLLQKNTKNLNHILSTKSLWNKPSQKKPLHLWDTLGNTGASLLNQPLNKKKPRKIETITTTIDNLCQSNSLKPELIKLDLQGTEHQALLGAKETLKTCQILIVEFGLLPAYENRTTPHQLLALLEPQGFLLDDILDLTYHPTTRQLFGGDFLLKKDPRLLPKNN